MLVCDYESIALDTKSMDIARGIGGCELIRSAENENFDFIWYPVG